VLIIFILLTFLQHLASNILSTLKVGHMLAGVFCIPINNMKYAEKHDAVTFIFEWTF